MPFTMSNSNPSIDDKPRAFPGGMRLRTHPAVDLLQECRSPPKAAVAIQAFWDQAVKQWFTIPIF